MATVENQGTPRRVIILGSTGSIGTQALDVIAANPHLFTVAGLSAGGSNIALLASQAVTTEAPLVAAASGSGQELKDAIDDAARQAGKQGYRPELLVGPDASSELAASPNADVVLNAITGSIGLAPTLAALKQGHLLALANKESLVVGGQLVHDAARPGQIVPVDSEHSALAQALRSGTPEEVQRLVLTASGGPFRGRTRAQMASVTPKEALAHPTWDMGLMVTTNSATMVNKALEVVEAHLLFDVPLDRIDVVVHPQSVVHSMVEFIDGSTIAQASPPDMRLPIALGIGWPHRIAGAATGCDWTKATSWTFEPLDEDAFPAVALAKEAAAQRGTAMAVYNAANEEAVAAFHAGRIGFTDIVDTVRAVLDEHSPETVLTLETVLDAEGWARRTARARCGFRD
ncbi:1-deoxy-D-xylulose-5-phosphate reductoisomerase [Arthrobacter sp. JZ12]|uniref:1-deoxy-D-xylulose-5-phosphate reductoisomerase n=1 Tax=Arthrobacter sp. JZ12 TaxID=2654190 RepID=UPI002B491770|nr:1-deoxy-D-xylulose-5-phosphate reductoisomerase [Arthrobacter sp. JZ12]WRH24591.1 1-deoxy-D-xylulose-5-phosphate reductoisomerase [Arthrobacter sp. JZ12]